ncbi:MAG TPA: hypothetical protein PK867_26105 [Pirellulales bacterium]|nr:hypothetical protein [Pirellulales bacterium]
MPETFDPYRKWLGISPKDQPPDHYRLLGIELFDDDPDVIEAAMTRSETCGNGATKIRCMATPSILHEPPCKTAHITLAANAASGTERSVFASPQTCADLPVSVGIGLSTVVGPVWPVAAAAARGQQAPPVGKEPSTEILHGNKSIDHHWHHDARRLSDSTL